jgi:hypothetical protein
MLKKLCSATVILFVVVSIAFAGSVPNMQEGKWEITTKMEMPGMPMNMPPMTYTQCLTKKDLVPKRSQPGQECTITQNKVTGSTVTWTMQCSGQGGDMKGTGNITYSGNSFNGTIKMTMPQQNMQMTSHVTGRRLGSCE